eukprot:TRINITY_DN6975_c0_g1_i3.p1 TRINITY_DN6975_c0_g1~~TRINITY_DN6975_c0_g1_i3.p1  ORF type:complete len:584 (+),score=126.94 TRINITY_DN6975_c0_g1_i3:67-1818(+)
MTAVSDATSLVASLHTGVRVRTRQRRTAQGRPLGSDEAPFKEGDLGTVIHTPRAGASNVQVLLDKQDDLDEPVLIALKYLALHWDAVVDLPSEEAEAFELDAREAALPVEDFEDAANAIHPPSSDGYLGSMVEPESVPGLKVASPLLPVTEATKEEEDASPVADDLQSIREAQEKFLARTRAIEEKAALWKQRLEDAKLLTTDDLVERSNMEPKVGHPSPHKAGLQLPPLQSSAHSHNDPYVREEDAQKLYDNYDPVMSLPSSPRRGGSEVDLQRYITDPSTVEELQFENATLRRQLDDCNQRIWELQRKNDVFRLLLEDKSEEVDNLVEKEIEARRAEEAAESTCLPLHASVLSSYTGAADGAASRAGGISSTGPRSEAESTVETTSTVAPLWARFRFNHGAIVMRDSPPPWISAQERWFDNIQPSMPGDDRQCMLSTSSSSVVLEGATRARDDATASTQGDDTDVVAVRSATTARFSSYVVAAPSKCFSQASTNAVAQPMQRLTTPPLTSASRQEESAAFVLRPPYSAASTVLRPDTLYKAAGRSLQHAAESRSLQSSLPTSGTQVVGHQGSVAVAAGGHL